MFLHPSAGMVFLFALKEWGALIVALAGRIIRGLRVLGFYFMVYFLREMFYYSVICNLSFLSDFLEKNDLGWRDFGGKWNRSELGISTI